MSNDKIRESFEEAWLSEFPQAYLKRAYSGEGYADDELQAAWDGYQMALARQPDSEPAAEVFERVGENGSYEEVVFYYDCPPGTKLYKCPQPSAQVPEIKESLRAIKAESAREFCQEIGLFNSEYDDQEYIEVSRHSLREYLNALYAAPSVAEKDQ